MEKVSGRLPTAPGSREPSPSNAVSAASGFDPSREWRERFAEVLAPHVWPGRHYAAADAVLAMPEWGGGIVFGDDMVEHRHSEFGQGYFSTPDATLFLNEMVVDHLRDSDGSGEAGETGTGSTEGNSAGLQGIAQPSSPPPSGDPS